MHSRVWGGDMAYMVQYSRYGGPDVLDVVDVTKPSPAAGEVVVQVMSAGLNPIDSSIREGHFAERSPAHFPEAVGSDFAGFISDVGAGATDWAVNDAVIGHVVRGAQATFVTVPADNIMVKPERLSWEVAGSLFVSAATAWKAIEDAKPGPGMTVLVHAAAGGVGALAAQLARATGATVIGTALPENFDYLRQWGVIPVEHGPGFEQRLAAVAPDGIDMELQHNLDDTIGIVNSTDMTALRRVADSIAARQLRLPIAAIYPLSLVQDAYLELETGHAHGKILLSMLPVGYARQKVQGVDIREVEATRDDPNRAPASHQEQALPPVIGHFTPRERDEKRR